MDKTLLRRILITLGFLLFYRILAYVPVPGVDVNVVKEFFTANSSNALGLFNMFSGNALSRMSIISLGIMPYITASIIMELLSATFPEIGKLKKERDGMTKYMQIIRYATILITIIQGIGRCAAICSSICGLNVIWDNDAYVDWGTNYPKRHRQRHLFNYFCRHCVRHTKRYRSYLYAG